MARRSSWKRFGAVFAEGGTGVVIASQSGHRLPTLSVEQNEALAITPVEECLRSAFKVTKCPDWLTSRHPIRLSDIILDTLLDTSKFDQK